MGEAIDIVLYVGVPVLLLILALVIGKSVEAAHFHRLAVREQALSQIMVTDLKRLPANWQASDALLVNGEAVVATDYFKVFAASLRNLFGGRVKSYESLLERARREAIVRMLQQAQAAGANVVWCVRLQTATIQGNQRGKSGGVEVLAYGTAMKVWEKQ
jgi:uncharacterized protein YbjQ (UPF0145 family)